MNYLTPTFILLAVITGYFCAGRCGLQDFGGLQVLLRVLVAVPLLLSGIWLHFFRAALTASIVPPGFPDPQILVFLSGIFEIAGAIGLFVPPLQRLSGLCIALMMVAVFPANINAAGRTVAGIHMPAIPERTAIQASYILLILVASYGWPSILGKRR